MPLAPTRPVVFPLTLQEVTSVLSLRSARHFVSGLARGGSDREAYPQHDFALTTRQRSLSHPRDDTLLGCPSPVTLSAVQTCPVEDVCAGWMWRR